VGVSKRRIDRKIMKTPAPNERFCVIAAVLPQIMQWELASYYPAASSVEAATSQSRLDVMCKRRTAQRDKAMKLKVERLNKL